MHRETHFSFSLYAPKKSGPALVDIDELKGLVPWALKLCRGERAWTKWSFLHIYHKHAVGPMTVPFRTNKSGDCSVPS